MFSPIGGRVAGGQPDTQAEVPREPRLEFGACFRWPAKWTEVVTPRDPHRNS